MQSPLHYAVAHGKYPSCLEILSSPDYKKIINEKDYNGKNAPLTDSDRFGLLILFMTKCDLQKA